MATVIRPEISPNNKYYVEKHRYYELKHFCLQYWTWKRTYAALNELSATALEHKASTNLPGDPTATCAVRKLYYSDRIELLERTAKDADEYLGEYILKAVTEGLSYTYLRTKLNIPCGRDTYYDRYRRFFWLLSNSRN